MTRRGPGPQRLAACASTPLLSQPAPPKEGSVVTSHHTATGNTDTPTPHAEEVAVASATAADPRYAGEDQLTTLEVAQQYRFKVGTLRYWRHEGRGPASFARGRQVLYRRREVEEWIADQERRTRRGGITP